MQGRPFGDHKSQTISNKTCKIIDIFFIRYNHMCYIWVSLKTWCVYVYTNNNIITYITKNGLIHLSINSCVKCVLNAQY
jgi:hypothetical protein